MKNKLIVLSILLGLLFPSTRNAYSETAPRPASDITVISFKIEQQKDTYPYPGPIGSSIDSMGNIYRNNAYLCVDLKNNSNAWEYANVPLRIYYYDKNDFKFSEVIVKTPNGEKISLGEEKKFRIFLEGSEYPYEQTVGFKYKVIVSPEDIRTTSDWRSLKVGMTQDEVRKILGEPTHIDEPASDSPTWTYYAGDLIPLSGSRVYFGTIGPLWNQKKLVVKKWEEPL